MTKPQKRFVGYNDIMSALHCVSLALDKTLG